MTIDIQTIIQSAVGLGFGLLMFFIKGAMKKLEQSITELRETQTTIKLIQMKLEAMEASIKDAARMSKELTDLSNRNALLERNLETCFKKLDECQVAEAKMQAELKANSDLFRRRTHHIHNKLMILKALAEKGSNIQLDEWALP